MVTTASTMGASSDGTSTGVIRLAGASTYVGETMVQSGTLLVNNTTGLGTGIGTVTINSGGKLRSGLALNLGASSLNISGAAAGTLNGYNVTLGLVNGGQDLVLQPLP